MPIPQDCGAICDLAHLVHIMADEYHARARGCAAPDQIKQLVNTRARQKRRGFIQNQHAGAVSMLFGGLAQILIGAHNGQQSPFNR